MQNRLIIKLLFFILILLLPCLKLKAQNVDFIFNKELNNLVVSKEGQSPYVFEILSKNGIMTIREPSVKRMTNFYKKTLAFYKKAKRDSIKIVMLKKESKYTSETAKNINETEVKKRLSTARRTLKNIKKYDITPSKLVNKEYNRLSISRSVFKPQNIILGEFKRLGAYRVTKSIGDYQESDLISVIDAKAIKLTIDDFLFGDVFEVIQNIETKNLYMVYPDFLEKYPINIVASQEKYKKKINASQKQIDNQIDLLIIDYIKSNKLN